MEQTGTLMDFFPTDKEFVVELRFRQSNEETAAKIMKSMMRQTDLLPDVYVEKVHCAAHSYKQMCSEDLLDGVAESYAKVTEAFNTFNSEVSSLINKDWNERAKQYMTDEEKVKLVDEVIQGFDFEKTRKMMMPSKAKVSIDELKVIARNLLFMCLEHQDREFWWAGGMHRGGLCACYDDKWGLSLNYIAVANKVRISKD